MPRSRSIWQRLRIRLIGGLVAPGLLVFAGESQGEPPALAPGVQEQPVVVQPAAPAVRVLDLAACRALALEKQPAIAAAQSSLSAAIARRNALHNLCVPTFLQRDLPTRRKQSCLGVSAAEASVRLAEIDTIYAVQYSFISCMYAKTQNALAVQTLGGINRLRSEFDKLLEAAVEEAARNELTQAKAKVEALGLLAEGRRQEASVGVERALSSLREAIGLDDECPLAQAASGQFQPIVVVDPKVVVHLALSQRPEIIQAATGTEVTDLEICAQKSRFLALTVWSFAAGSDIHANPLPTPMFGPKYRPGAVGPEMPVTINGKRCNRVEQAEIYNGRAHIVLEKTQKLIRLETEQAYFRWLEASNKLAIYSRGVKKAQDAMPPVEDIAKRAGPGPLTANLDTARLLTDLRFEVNRARYEMLLALIGLERATAGGFCAGLEKAPVVVESFVEPAAKSGKEAPRK